jgi:hypothetical protein
VHSTPPINTSALPAGLARQQRERVKALKRAARLRQKAADEIERLLAFLDASDPYTATEPEEAVDDRPCDGDSDAEPSLGSFDRMSDQTKAWSTRSTYAEIEVDAEHDTSDAEPALAAPENHPQPPYTAIGYTGGLVVYGPADQHRDGSGSQHDWAQGNRDDREGDPGCDDREPDDGLGRFPSQIDGR